jgi:hypothetical protein
MTREERAALHKAIDAELQKAVPPDLKAKGWRYMDIPGRFAPDKWEKLLHVMGQDEYRLIAFTTGETAGKTWKRGQFFVSPQAIKNLGDTARWAKNYRERRN